MNQAVNLVYGPRLIEEAVFHARHDRSDTGELDQRRNPIYEIADMDERDRLFNELNRVWFDRLGLGKVIEQSLREQPLIGTHVERCFVVGATQTKEEGAELFVAPDPKENNHARRTLRLLIRPESLVNKRRHFAAGVLTSALTKGDVQPLLETPFEGSTPESAWSTINADPLRTFLRHELFHISDMLDPAFAYEPTLPKAEGGPTYDTLIINRYRVLWDVTIAGRMLRRGWCAATVREQQLNDFRIAFPMLDKECEDHFKRFFDAVEPCHKELAAFAFEPRAATDNHSNQAVAGTHCPLCRFPTHAFVSEPANLGADVLAAIKEDFPDWTAAKGVCVQCADLYHGHQMSMDALRLLPGYHSGSVQE